MPRYNDGSRENGAPANVDHHQQQILPLPSRESEGIITQTKDTSLTVSLAELNSKDTGTGGIACPQEHSLINTLCPEIIAEIFMHCIPKSQFGNIPDLSEAPLLLVQICRYWRDVAMSTPQLWCSLRVDVDTSCFDSSRANLMRTWLDRSKMSSYPLCLCVVGVDGNIPECISVMVAHMSRCSKLSLVLDCSMLSELQDVTVPLPFLEDLYLDNSLKKSFTVAVKTFAGASRLRSVKLRCPGALLDVTVLPWRQLQELFLRIEGKTIVQCWEVLEQCRVLVHLDITVYNSELEDLEAWTAVERGITDFPNLQTLKIDAHVETYRLDLFLGCWVVPKLRCLEIKGSFGSAGITDLLSRSTPELRQLDVFTLRTFFRAPEDATLLLRCLPSLVVLILDVKNQAQRYSRSLIESLIYRPSLNGDGSCLLPNLRVLNLRQVEGLEFAKDMLKSRCALEDLAGKGVPAHPVVRLDEAEIRSAHDGSGWTTRWFINDKGDVESHRRFSASSTRAGFGGVTSYSQMQAWGRWTADMTAESNRIPPPSEPRLCSADLNALVYE